MQTVIDQVLEIIELAREGEIDNDLRSIKYRIEKLVPVFKQQLIDFGHAMQIVKSVDEDGINFAFDPEEYYRETFK